MSLRGSCRCNNIEVVWHTVDYSVVPRACQCEYCLAKGAAYVCKSGTAVNIQIHNERLHRTIAHGSNTAQFHECKNCGDLVLVTAQIDGDTYAALNAACLKNAKGFAAAVCMDFAEQTAEQKVARWRQNWCRPVSIVSPGSETLTAPLPETSGFREGM